MFRLQVGKQEDRIFKIFPFPHNGFKTQIEREELEASAAVTRLDFCSSRPLTEGFRQTSASLMSLGPSKVESVVLFGAAVFTPWI